MRKALIALLFCLASLTMDGAAVAQHAVRSETAELAPFAPNDAAIFVIVRPRQLAESELMLRMREGKQKPPQPIDVDAIEFVAFAVSGASISDAAPRSPNSTIANIAQTIHQGKEISDARFAMLVRFNKPTSSQEVINLFTMAQAAGEQAPPKYRAVPWKGKEILRSDNKNAPAGLRVDDRTYVVADLKSFVTGIQQNTVTARQAMMWTKLSRMATADFAVAVDSQQMLEFASKQSPQLAASAQQSDSIAIGMGITEGDLVVADVEFVDTASMTETLASLQMLHQFGLMQASSAMDPEMAELALPILRSLQIAGKGTTMSVRLPRPENWDQIVDRLVEQAEQGGL